MMRPMGMYRMLRGRELVEPSSLVEWTEWFGKGEQRRIGFERVGDSEVSTVCLGSDHGWDSDVMGYWFETLVFGGPLAGEMERYKTYDEAAAGHAQMVERVRATQQKGD